MPFLLRVELPLARLPSLGEVLDHLGSVFETTVRLDEDAERAMKRGLRAASWCPWPIRTLGLYVEGASSRGTEVALNRRPEGVEVQICQHVMGTWTDWRMTLELAIHLAEAGDGYANLQGGGRVSISGLRRRYIEDSEQYDRELLAGLDAIQRAVEDQQRTVRLGGPRGTAAVGPRTWARISVAHEEPEERAEAVVEALLASLDARGFEGFYPANLLCLDGRTGREVLASLLPPDVNTLLRDPEYVLLSADLEAGPREPLKVLPFDRLDAAFPGRVHWIDDCTAAVAAIPRSQWVNHIANLDAMLTPLSELLDGPPEEGEPEAWRRFVPDDDSTSRPS
ncbi:MAG: hypothetical protein KDA24_05230 [Deltaproteobacteria bacterium]|nr:hypothetical protein [Deltaproteobacteria bacterium]